MYIVQFVYTGCRPFLTDCVHRVAYYLRPNRGTERKHRMDRVAEDAVAVLHRDEGAGDGCYLQPGHPFPSDRHPCGAGRVAAADGVATGGDGDGGDGVTSDPVVREYRSRASNY